MSDDNTRVSDSAKSSFFVSPEAVKASGNLRDEVFNATPRNVEQQAEPAQNRMKDLMRLYKNEAKQPPEAQTPQVEIQLPQREKLQRQPEAMAQNSKTATAIGGRSTDEMSSILEKSRTGEVEASEKALLGETDWAFSAGTNTWIYNKEVSVTRMGMIFNVPAAGMLYNSSPKTSAFMIGMAGLSNIPFDASNFYNAETAYEQFKYGSALAADSAMIAGSAASLSGKRSVGDPMMAGGLVGRVAIDLAPDRVVVTSHDLKRLLDERQAKLNSGRQYREEIKPTTKQSKRDPNRPLRLEDF